MHLKSVSYQGIRNLKAGRIELSKELNVFFGDNGAGKSSILEAIGFLTTARSFRTAKTEHLVTDGQSEFTIFGLSAEDVRIGFGFQKSTKSRTVKVNGEKLKALSSLTSLYPTQILSPESYHLIDSGPSERRKYLDWCLFHVEHSYHKVWKQYANNLSQRNALLKTRDRKLINQQIPVWDSQLCSSAHQVNQFRQDILKRVQGILQLAIAELGTKFCGKIKLDYYPGFSDDLQSKLKSNLNLEIDCGYTRYGPHKADLRIKVDSHQAKDFLSRGQKKVLINAMFLAQTILLKEETHKDSLFVIDDYTSELDKANQKALLAFLLKQDNVQIMLSCLQQDSLNWLNKGYNNAHMFHVERGEISRLQR